MSSRKREPGAPDWRPAWLTAGAGLTSADLAAVVLSSTDEDEDEAEPAPDGRACDKREQCGCHPTCTVLPHACEQPCRWPACLTEAEAVALADEVEADLLRGDSEGIDAWLAGGPAPHVLTPPRRPT